MSIIDTIRNPQFLLAALTFIAVIATVITLAMPYLAGDKLQARMKYVSLERERIRARERARLAAEASTKASLRPEPKAYMKNLVDRFNLRALLADEKTIQRLRMAGFRGQAPLVVFLFARFVLPLVLFLIAIVYLFWVLKIDRPAMLKVFVAAVVGFLGFYAPNLYVSNAIQKRQASIKKAFPDALDLLLICVESGMSIEQAFRRVSEEIGSQSVPLAEELSLTTAELSYLQDRRQAYENLGNRTGLDGVRGVTLSLIQAERYGTPLGQTLRVLAQENRDMRMNEAEKKAAALPPKLTVPMILFFLPVLFAVIMTPAIIQVMAN